MSEHASERTPDQGAPSETIDPVPMVPIDHPDDTVVGLPAYAVIPEEADTEDPMGLDLYFGDASTALLEQVRSLYDGGYFALDEDTENVDMETSTAHVTEDNLEGITVEAIDLFEDLNQQYAFHLRARLAAQDEKSAPSEPAS